MSEIVKVKVWIATNRVGSEVSDTLEFEREEWESMTDEERNDVCKDQIWNFAEWGFELVE